MKYTVPLLVLLSGLILTSCHNDNDGTPLTALQEKTYSAKSLELYYNGQPMPNKSVTFDQNGDKATVTIFSRLDLSSLGKGMKGVVPGPGALPGAPETVLDVDLNPADSDWQFTGTGDNGYCSYSYSGYVNADLMKLFLNDVKLKSGGVKPSVWAPAPSRPFYIDWQYDPIPGVDVNFSPIVEALTTLPLIPVYGNTAYMSINEAVEQTLKTVAFKEDGNLIFTYISSVGGAYHIAQTMPNRFQYVISSPTQVKVFIDPMSAVGLFLTATSGSTPAEDVNLTDKGLFPASDAPKSSVSDSVAQNPEMAKLRAELMASAMKWVMPKLSEGFTFSFTAGAQGLDIYIDTESAVSMISEILLPVLKDEANVKALMSQLAANPATASILPQLQKVLPLLPQAFERTNTLRLGFALIPYTTK